MASQVPSAAVVRSFPTFIVGLRAVRHLGNLNLYIIKESASLRVGEFPLFLHEFILEMQCICRAHILSRGGNALISYKITHCQIVDSQSGTQGQALLMITGDIVELRADDALSPSSGLRMNSTPAPVTASNSYHAESSV
jgi:hypothetical protein